MENIGMQTVLIGLQILGMCVTVAAFAVIKFNDLTHLAKNVEELKVKVEEIKKDQVEVSGKVIEIKTRCEERYGK